jgi:hypothetical protein
MLLRSLEWTLNWAKQRYNSLRGQRLTWQIVGFGRLRVCNVGFGFVRDQLLFCSCVMTWGMVVSRIAI